MRQVVRLRAYAASMASANVGWVERSDTHHSSKRTRWVSLRSTHPTFTGWPQTALTHGRISTSCQEINLDTAVQCAIGLGCFVPVADITASRKRTLVGWVERNDTHPTFADAMLAAYVLNLTTCLNLLQHPHNLILAEPGFTHPGLVVCRKTTSYAWTALWEGYRQSAPPKFINTHCARQTPAISQEYLPMPVSSGEKLIPWIRMRIRWPHCA